MTIDTSQPATLLKDLLNLDLNKCDITVCIAARESNAQEFTYRRIKQSQSLERQFREVVSDALKQYRDAFNDGNLVLQDFTAETVKEEQEIEHLNIGLFDSIKRQIAPVKDYLDIPYFRHNERDFVRNMRFYVVCVTVPGEPESINFYHRYSHTQMLSESSYFAMTLHGEEYQKLEDPTFLFERHIDCFSYEGDMFILQKNNFFQIFDIGELEKVARDTLNKLELKDFIHNFQEFKKDCLRDRNKILKLCNIASGGYLDTFTIDKLHRVIKDLGLPIDVNLIGGIGGKKKLTYNSKERWAILNLLEDTYPKSTLTNYDYHVKGKRRIARK